MRVFQYVETRYEEIQVIALKAFQISVNFVLLISLRNEQKVKQPLAIHKTPVLAQQISQSLQNHNLGSFYPEYIRALISLYLFSLIIHLIHDQIMKAFQRKLRYQQLISTILMVGLQILDLLTINDIILLNSEHNNLSNAMSEVYTEKRQKEVGIEVVLRQLLNINKFLSFVFQSQTLWLDGIKPLIKQKRRTSFQDPPPPPPIEIRKRPASIEKKPQLPRKRSEQTSAQKKKKAPPPQLQMTKQISTDIPTFDVPLRNTHRSQTQPKSSRQMIRFASQISARPQKQMYFLLEQTYKFHLQTNIGEYDFVAPSIAEFNAKLDKIAKENFWSANTTLNVKLSYWINAYKINDTPIIKQELQKIIAQYMQHIMTSQL